MLSRVGRGRAGFTLLELAVVIAVIALLAGLIMTRVVGRTTQAQIAALTDTFGTIGDAVQVFRGDVGRYPALLTYLTESPPSTATDPCTRTIPTTALDGWRGPYLDRRVQTTGIPVGDAYVANQLRRVPSDLSTTSFGMLYVDASEVDRSTAESVDLAIDGAVDLGAGSVVWLESGSTGRGRLSFGIPVRGC